MLSARRAPLLALSFRRMPYHALSQQSGLLGVPFAVIVTFLIHFFPPLWSLKGISGLLYQCQCQCGCSAGVGAGWLQEFSGATRDCCCITYVQRRVLFRFTSLWSSFCFVSHGLIVNFGRFYGVRVSVGQSLFLLFSLSWHCIRYRFS